MSGRQSVHQSFQDFGKRPVTTQEVIDKVEGLVRKDLEGCFQDEFVFDPIIVNPELDHYGDEFLHIYIIFDGDQKKLDPKWTVGLERRILEDVPVDEVTRLPGHAFIPKSEWKEVCKERVL